MLWSSEAPFSVLRHRIATFLCKSYLLLEICLFIDFSRQWRVDGSSKDRQTVDSILGIGSRVWMIFVLEFCDKSIYDGCVKLYCIPHPWNNGFIVNASSTNGQWEVENIGCSLCFTSYFFTRNTILALWRTEIRIITMCNVCASFTESATQVIFL